MSAARVVVLGAMGGSPFAGVAWQVLHFVEGLRRLGCSVAYVEDTGAWPYDPIRNTVTDESDYAVGYIGGLMRGLDMGEAWAYVAPDGRVHGQSDAGLRRLLAEADALINLTGATILRDEHLAVPVRIYLETDPVLPQVEVAQGQRFTIDLLAAHTHHFSFGEKLGDQDCAVPVERFRYRPTRQPVVLDWWPPSKGSPAGAYTTVASWHQGEKDVEWRGESYFWSKDREFTKFIELPRRCPVSFELALARADAEAIAALQRHGWRVHDGVALSRDLDRYRRYLLESRAEFTVGKDQNVRLRSGWSSDRSACYLAAGKPVVTQDTGFGDVIPTGRGLFAFRTLDEAAASVSEIERDYAAHSRAARELAHEFFRAERVLSSLLERAGLGAPAGTA